MSWDTFLQNARVLVTGNGLLRSTVSQSFPGKSAKRESSRTKQGFGLESRTVFVAKRDL